jgi:DNA repair protein RecN (Recombination protein N)
MISDISISNLGVISEARLPLGPGLTVVTGETGAGKTMVVTALGLLLGARADSARVRSGSSATWVEGRFLVGDHAAISERVSEAGGALDDGELVLAREVHTEGRSRAIVGGRTAPVSMLADLAEHLVVIHGQSDQIRLKSEGAQRAALDRFAGDALQRVLVNYEEAFSRYRELEAKRQHFEQETATRAKEVEELSLALADIEAISPTAGEDVELQESIARLTNTEDLRVAAQAAKEAINTEESGPSSVDATELLDRAVRALERVAAFDPAVEKISTTLREAGYHLAEANTALAGYLAGLESGSGQSLEQCHERLAGINALIRRYGPTLNDVLELAATGSDRLLELDQHSDTLESLTTEAAAALELATTLSSELSALRSEAAAGLGSAVTKELAALAMPTATLHVVVTSGGALTTHGVDTVSIQLSAHPGADPLPLGKGASGGELSRVMLALEVVIAGSDPVPTFVFDEVDAGVGGASALEIGRRLDALAHTSQVIVVTHLAQVAAYANNHLRVVKDTDGQVTTSSVVVLEGEERVTELARMLGGMADSQTALSHARELLEKTHSVSRR